MADAAVIEKLEAGFAKLQAATDCKSLLRKYLTKDVFDQLKTKKTALGATLLDVIQSGWFFFWFTEMLYNSFKHSGSLFYLTEWKQALFKN